MMSIWNHSVHLWLKRGVQERVLTPGKKAGLYETFVTFMLSAIWHGLYPFYYVMFFFCAIIVELSKEIFRSRSLFTFLPPLVSHILCNCLTMICCNYLGSALTMLTFERGGNFMRGTKGLPFIVLLVSLFLWKALGITKMAQKASQKKVDAKTKKE